MGLTAAQFTNNNANFNVTFNVIDGYQKITPIEATVTITGHKNTSDYDGKEHSVSGYDVSFSTPLYTEADFTFSGTAAASRTDAGTTDMELSEEQFANTNTNFSKVTFNVTDGYQKIDPIDVTVIITGHTSTVPYDGEAHTASGYDVTIENPLYKQTDFTFTGTATATRTNVVEGEDADGQTDMGLNAAQFTNNNTNFKTVTFNVVDGYQKITPIKTEVEIVGNNSTVPYDGEAHTVNGYVATAKNALYNVETDIEFSGEAKATRTNVVEGEDADGQTDMGLTEDQFSNKNPNFSEVTFKVTDGYQKITPINATVTIVGANSTDVYDGTEHKVTGYTATADTALYDVTKDFTFTPAEDAVLDEGVIAAKRTEEGTTNMGLAEEQFANTNTNFETVTFNVTDGYQTITPVDEVVVTITGHNSTDPYDGEAHTVTGYDVKISNPLYKEADFTFSGTATAARTNVVEGEDADGQTDMGLKEDQFKNNNKNFSKVTFVVTDGYQKITPIDVTVNITGKNSTDPYDGEEHKVEGYTASCANELYDVTKDFTFKGKAEAARTNVVEGEDTDGQTDMGLTAEQFTNNNTNFKTVTFNVVDGYQKITPVTDKVTVKITGHNDTKDYDGKEHKVTGYDATDDNDLYDVTKDVAFSGTDEAERKDVGTTNMGLAAEQFQNTNANFTNVVFDVTDGYQKIDPTKVTVTIVGNNNTTDYDGKPHTVEGFRATSDNILYSAVEGTNYTFSGTKTATRTDAGQTDMGLKAEQFVNNNKNFIVTFDVTDGYQKITPVDEVVVTIKGHTGENPYDGKEHSVSGYDVEIDNPLYKEADFTFSGTAAAARTNVVEGEDADGQTDMGLTEAQFTNNNKNFAKVTFKVTDGYQKITPINATVTIVGAYHTDVYDGAEHKVEGYTATADNALYDVTKDFTFSGKAEAARTEEGTTNMNLAANQFTNNNKNFATVTFDVTDGYQTITPVDEVVVTIKGHTGENPYDGKEHSVSGYDVEISNPLYKEADFTFSGTATAARTNVVEGEDADGQTDMGLKEDQFKNNNKNFSKVTFVVTDGYQKITPIDVTVNITGKNSTDPYDGEEHKVEGYTASCANELYDVTKDFTFKGKAEAARTNVVEGEDTDGQTDMGLTAEQFTNNNTNFKTVTFNVVDGYQKITPVTDKVTVKITGRNDTKDYDGKEHKVTGYDAEADNKLYDVTKDFTFSGTAEAVRTDVGTTNMGLAASQFANTNRNFTNVVFEVTDGFQKINPIDVKVTIVGNNNTTDYDGEAHTVTGYKATADNNLYDVTKDFTFSGKAEATRTEAGTTNMGLAADQFTNTNTNFKTVTFDVTDGYQKINPIDVTVTIVGNNNTTAYDGEEHTVTGYRATADNDLYDVTKDFTFTPAEDATLVDGVIAAKRTEEGTTNMGLAKEQFANKNGNFKTVTFNVTDGFQTITAMTDKVTVTITENRGTEKYDGSEKTVEGYTVSISNPLYTENDFTFSGNATVKGTDAGTYNMELKASDFTNTSENFSNVEFVIVDGTLTITKRSVTLTSAAAEKIYDGAALVSQIVTVTGDGFVEGEGATYNVTGSQTDVGSSENTFTYALNEGTKAANYVIEQVLGTLTVNPKTAKVTVTITENSGTEKYDGSEKTVEGYTVETSDPLYTEDDFTFSGDATVTGTDAGTYNMELKASDFHNTSENITNVEFVIVDGTLTIEKRAVTLTSADDEKAYDGEPLTNDEVTVTGDGFAEGEGATYDVTGSQTEVGNSKNTFTYTLNEGTNADNYTITKTEGTLNVTAMTDKVTVTITENSDKVTYDGEAHTIEGYKSIVADNELYDVTKAVKETKTDAWTVTETNAGTYDMGIAAEDFKNIDKNFGNVEFVIVDGQLVIDPISDKVTVTITENSDKVTYDGEAHTIDGYKSIVADNELYDVTKAVKETKTDAWTVTETNAGKYDMGIAAEDFENIDSNFSNVEFKIVDGRLVIEPASIEDPENPGKPDSTRFDVSDPEDTKYNGQEQKQPVTVHDKTTGKDLIEDTDYTIEYTPAVNAGEVTVTITGKGNYTGEVIKKYNITKRTVQMTSATDEKFYDGIALVAKIVEDVAEGFDGFVEGEGATYDVTGSQTLPGTSDNAFEYALKEGTLATNYIITEVLGKLTVKDREDPEDPDNPDPKKDKYQVTFTAKSDEATYDGKPHGVEGFVEENEDGSLTYTNDKGVTFTIKDISASEEQIDAGEYPVEVEGTAKVFDPDGNDVTAQFTIKPVDGKLVINPAELPKDPDDPEDPANARFDVSKPEDVPYNGEAQEQKVSITDKETGEELVEGKDYTLSYSGDTTNVTDTGVTITVTGKGNYAGTFTRSYHITPIDLTLISASDEKVYDGTPLTNDNVTVEGLAPADEGKLEFNVTGSQTYVGQSENTFEYKWVDEDEWTIGALETVKSYFVVYAAEGDEASLAKNYNVSTVKGTLTVTDDVDDDVVIQKTHKGKSFKVGEVITFTIKVKNIYDEPKTITIEEQDGVVIKGQSQFTDVAPGETVTTTAVHKVTEADVKAGTYTNIATASFDGGKTFEGKDTVDKLVKTAKSGRPDTGDNGYGFDLTMMFGSAAAFLAMLFGRRRREQE